MKKRKEEDEDEEGILVLSCLTGTTKGILVISLRVNQFAVPPHKISDVAVSNLVEGRNFK